MISAIEMLNWKMTSRLLDFALLPAAGSEDLMEFTTFSFDITNAGKNPVTVPIKSVNKNAVPTIRGSLKIPLKNLTPIIDVKIGVKNSINSMAIKNAITDIATDSPINWETSCSFPAPTVLRIPISFDLLNESAVVRFI